jgi:hypothetical protein
MEHQTQLVDGNVDVIRAAASLAPDCRLPGLHLQSATGTVPRPLLLGSYPPPCCAGRALFPISTPRQHREDSGEALRVTV